MGSVWLPALLGAGIGAGVLLLIVGLRGVTVDPTRPPSRADRAAAAIRSPALAGRILGAVAVGALTLVLTRWPVAAAGMAALVLLWPKLFGGSNAEQRQIARGDASSIARSSLDELDRGLGLVANSHPEPDWAADASRVVGAVAPGIVERVGPCSTWLTSHRVACG